MTDEYTAFYHETQGNTLVRKGQVFAWLYSNPEARYHLSTGRHDLVVFPRAGRHRWRFRAGACSTPRGKPTSATATGN
jgi:hypothetical protein